MSSTRGNTTEVRVSPWRLTWWHTCLNYLTPWAYRSKGPLSWWPSRQFCKLNHRPTICFSNEFEVVFSAEASPPIDVKYHAFCLDNLVGQGRNGWAAPRWLLLLMLRYKLEFLAVTRVEIEQRPLISGTHRPDLPPVSEGYPMREWSIRLFVVGPNGEELPATMFDRVTYRLHPTFQNPNRGATLLPEILTSYHY